MKETGVLVVPFWGLKMRFWYHLEGLVSKKFTGVAFAVPIRAEIK